MSSTKLTLFPACFRVLGVVEFPVCDIPRIKLFPVGFPFGRGLVSRSDRFRCPPFGLFFGLTSRTLNPDRGLFASTHFSIALSAALQMASGMFGA